MRFPPRKGSKELTTEELVVANLSCDACLFSRKPDYLRPETWLCEAPENLQTRRLDPVTGKSYPLYATCYDCRNGDFAGCGAKAVWRVAQFLVLSDGSVKYLLAPETAEPFKPTGVLSPSMAKLRKLTADDF